MIRTTQHRSLSLKRTMRRGNGIDTASTQLTATLELVGGWAALDRGWRNFGGLLDGHLTRSGGWCVTVYVCLGR